MLSTMNDTTVHDVRTYTVVFSPSVVFFLMFFFCLCLTIHIATALHLCSLSTVVACPLLIATVSCESETSAELVGTSVRLVAG